MRSLALVLTLASAALLTSTTQAQDPAFMPFPVGDRALGAGGAFTGLSEDVSAIWYDPGGLALLGSTSVSASLSFTVTDSFTIDDGYASRGRTASLSDEGSPNVPFFVGVVGKVGPEQNPRDRDHALALAVIRPTRTGRRFELTLPADASGTTSALRIREDDDEELYGAAYAYQITERLGVGASAFLHLRSFFHEENEVTAVQGVLQPDGTFMGSVLDARSTTAELSSLSLLFRLGALLELDDHLRVGIAFQPPNVPLSTSGRVAEHRATTDLGASSATFYDADQDLDGGWPLPWELRLGIAWKPHDLLGVSLDGSLLGPLGSESDPVRPFGQPTPPTTGVPAPTPGRFVAESFRTQVTANMAVGAQTVVADIFPVGLGFFTAFSPVPSLVGPSPSPRAARLDAVGATLVVGFTSAGYNVAIGTAYVHGWGSVDRPDDSEVGYVPTDARSHALFLFVTGAASAAKRLAGTVYQEVFASDEERTRRASEEAELERLERLREECERRLREELERTEPGTDTVDERVEPELAPEAPLEN